MSITSLPTIKHKIRTDLIAELERTIEQVRRGEIVHLIMIKDGRSRWGQYCSGAMDYPRAIGQLEIIKQDWMEEYRHECDRVR